jgi:hypothetical protein
MSEGSTTTIERPAPEAPDPRDLRSNGAVPPPNGHRAVVGENGHQEAVVKRGAEAPGVETWLIALFFGVVYGVIGYFMLTDGRIVNFDALQQLNNAYMSWWNSPPKLAAIPLDAPPLGSIAFLPLTLIKPLASSLVALPVITAVAAGLLMALLNSTMRRCEFPTFMRYAFLVLFGLNPMFIFYAGNGDSTVIGMMFAGVALLSLISWRLSAETRYLALAGLAMGVASMFDYGYFFWAVGITIAIMFIGGDRDDSQDRRRSSLIVFLMPVVYALMLWILINAVILGSPFDWITTQSNLIEVNTTGALEAITADWGSTFSNLGEVVLGIAPLGFLTVLLLLFAGIFKRSGLAWGLLFLIVLAVAVPVGRTMIADQADLMSLAVGLPLALLAFAGAAWVYRSEESLRVGVAIAMAAGLIAAIPLGWMAMQDYRYQDQAQAFTRWVEDRDTQEGTNSIGGYTVGVDPEVAMASYITESVPQEDKSILVDENFSYGPMILSGRPQLFADRADEGEGEWEMLIEDPFDQVSYMLITTSRGGDQLRKRYPDAISGGELGITPVFRTGRYVLLEVSPTEPPAEGVALPGQVVPNSAPEPFTPQAPPNPSDPDAVVVVPGTAPESTVTPTPAPESTTGPGPSGGSTAPQIEGE